MDDPSRLRILVVEDEADARRNLRDILELDDHEVVEAADASSALDRTDWSALDVVILDRLLPDADALQLVPRLRGLAPSAALIVVTGLGDIQGAIAALRQGAEDYLLKPLNPDALRASLGRLAERRRLAAAKERSEAAFRQLVEAAECLIVILRPDRTTAYFSPFGERLTGYAQAEVLGRDYFELFLPEPERSAALGRFARVLGGGQASGYQTPHLCRDGSRRWVVWNARLLSDHDGGGPAVLAVGQDITGLLRAQEQALQAGRLAAIGQMVAGLAHESRNALQRSQACLEMLRYKLEDRPETLGLLDRLQLAQDHLHHLYEDVRGYAAPIQLERRPARLDAVWREAWSHLEAARAGRQASLVERARGLDLTAPVDPFRLGQVFRNLFENALAAAAPPVVVTVEVEPADLEDRPALRVRVRDNGPGLSPDGRRNAFEPFFTTKTKGTGLGLSIARRIVEAHGGRIVPGEGGPGAEFCITLPRERESR